MEQNIKDSIEQVKYKIEPAKKENAYTLVFEKEGQKKYIMSKYTPVRESKELLGSDLGNKETVWIFFGFAFGYMVDEVLEKCGEDIRIVIIEPSEALLLEQIDRTHKEDLLTKENVTIYTGSQYKEIKRLFINSIFYRENNFKVITRNGYLEFYREYYTQVTKILNEVVTDIIIQHNTFENFGGLFLKNVIHNRYAIQEGYDLTYHKNKYKNIPALIVSGGPSLSKNIKWISKFKGLIFTGGRTLTPVLQQGVEPDFLVSADPQDITYETLRENAHNALPLITINQGNDKVVAANKGPKYFLEDDGVSKEFLGIQKSVRLSMGGSVATLCISAAQYMGCNPIVLIGQDLAYTDMKMHADECSNEYLGDKNRGKNKIEAGEDYIASRCKQVKSVGGGKVWTNDVLLNYLRWIEAFIELCTENEFINATEGGAWIQGAVHKPFEEVVNQFATINKPRIQHIKLDDKINIDQNIEDSMNTLDSLKKMVKQAERLAKQLVDEYTIHKGLREKKIIKILKQLDEIDDEIKSCGGKKNIVEFLFTTTYGKLERNKKYKQNIGDTKFKQDKKIAEYNYAVYKELGKVIVETIKLINKEMTLSGKE